MRFWFDRGIAGFRIDVCHMIVKDAELRDNPPATSDDHWIVRVFGQRLIYNANRPEVHDVMRRWRVLADSYDPPRVLVGETNVNELDTMASYYGKGDDELHLAFNFPFINADFEAEQLRRVFETTLSLLPEQAWPAWTGSNHDVSRLASRWAGGDPVKCRAALMMLLTLPGTPVLYQGDEIGLPDTNLTVEQLKDPVGIRYWPGYPGRDPVRTPMPWRDEQGAGFTPPHVTPWLPLGDVGTHNVEAQRGRAGSLVNLTHELIALRRATPDLQIGAYTRLPAPTGVWRWRRGDTTTVVLNLSETGTTLDDAIGRIALGTDPNRNAEAVSGTLDLRPWEGAIIDESGQVA
jgi:alpha-glucosidase